MKSPTFIRILDGTVVYGFDDANLFPLPDIAYMTEPRVLDDERQG